VQCVYSRSITAIINSRTRLTSTKLRNNNVNSVHVQAVVTRYPSLLSLAFTRGKDADIAHIATQCPSLTHIDLTNTAMGDAGVAALSACSRLQHVLLSFCRNVGDEGVDALATACPLITYLMLHATKVGSVGMTVVGMKTVELTHVACEPGQALVTGKWLKLLFLHISGHDITVCNLAQRFPLLEHFHVTATILNDEGLHTLFASACVNLKGVDMVCCRNVSEVGIVALAKCTNWTSVHIVETRVSEEGMRALKVALPALLYFNGELKV